MFSIKKTDGTSITNQSSRALSKVFITLSAVIAFIGILLMSQLKNSDGDDGLAIFFGLVFFLLPILLIFVLIAGISKLIQRRTAKK